MPAANSKIMRSEPPDAASIRPTGTSPSRCAGSEIAQPSIVLIIAQLRKMGHPISWYNMGGGFGISYKGHEARPIAVGALSPQYEDLQCAMDCRICA